MKSADSSVILGINAYHGDSSACILVDGRLVTAVEEERLRRIKHWAGFPSEAARWCIAKAGLTAADISHVALNRNPGANLWRKIAFSMAHRPQWSAIWSRASNARHVHSIRAALSGALKADLSRHAAIHHVEHHRAHLASAFFVSPFDRAAVVSIDGFGDFVSTMWGLGEGARLLIGDSVYFPHSLGIFYLGMTQYLGFKNYGDEYKVMGLAAYGKPVFADQIRQMVTLKSGGRFELNLKYFNHHTRGVQMSWKDAAPCIGDCYSDEWVELLGPQRTAEAPLEQRHKDWAASTQQVFEEALFHVLREAHRRTKSENLCLAGGCGFNSLANGKITTQTPFKNTYVQAASGDAGGALGAAYYVWNQKLRNPRRFVMDHAYWGPEYDAKDIVAAVEARRADIASSGCLIRHLPIAHDLCSEAAKIIASGGVLGWFQGRLEWGPRALGNRSILCDPRRPDAKKLLNLKIKHRESFRPFAPSILREAARDWFEIESDVPFMTHVYPIRKEKRSAIPAVTHADGTGRLQTVTEGQNPIYYRLIRAFADITGVPILLNTSFNDNEPIVCRPEEALDCFLRTRMDALVLGDQILTRAKDSVGGT